MTPYRQYYAFDLIPAYWEELSKHIDAGRMVLLDMVKDKQVSGSSTVCIELRFI